MKTIALVLSVVFLYGCEVSIELPSKKEVILDRGEIICLDGYKQRAFSTHGGYGNSPVFDPETSKVIPCDE